MYKVVVYEFGGPEQLKVVEADDPVPGCGQVVVRMTSVGLNHGELMQRRGVYRILSGDPPFVPGLEGGGVIDSVGEGVTDRRVGQRVVLTLDSIRGKGAEGTYQSHFVTDAAKTVPAPDAVPDEMLGALWMPYLTSWGCLVWKQDLQPGQTVLIPAASSGVGLAAAQVVKAHGGIAIGTTTSAEKVQTLQGMPEAKFDHVILTRDRQWWRDVKQVTEGKGCDVIFDPVGAGEFLSSEIRLLAQGGTLWVYGLLGETGAVDVSPLIRKWAAIRGWAMMELEVAGDEVLEAGYRDVFDHMTSGDYRLPVAKAFPLRDAAAAHREIERGEHVGKFVLIPS
ncbi:MAG: zinc-dependent alcohol dehydrogenase family protein [Planctomycetes bacterium]|nr:zinc-dependent alcohol dehydrogenase family protein [Planctomycetota bacterium]